MKSELPHWLILAAMFGLAAITWPSAPDQIPVHWNAAGQVDRYGTRPEGLLLLPVVALAIYGLLRLLPMIDPKRANYASFASAYNVLRLAVLALLAAVYGLIHLWLRGIQIDVGTVVPLLLGLLFLVLGAVLPRIRPNWLVGIRTPWTLTSEVAWTRTHRVGSWLFALFGVAAFCSACLLQQ